MGGFDTNKNGKGEIKPSLRPSDVVLSAASLSSWGLWAVFHTFM